MFLRSAFPPQRPGISRIDVIVAANLLVLMVLLLLPACYRARVTDARTQSINNLKQIGLAMQSFHDGNKRLPFNGIAAFTKTTPAGSLVTYSGNAMADNPASGSWLFQILPYADHAPMFHLNGIKENDPIPANFLTTGASIYMCPGRGRQQYEDGKGAWSDYFINNYLNDPMNADKADNADARLNLVGISDGTSQTIFAGHGNIARGDYAKTRNVAGSSNIFVGGTFGTARGGPKWVKGAAPKVALQRDSDTPAVLAAGGWGGPYPQGGLMAWCDGTVRLVPYSTSAEVFGAYLTPAGNEDVKLPD